MAKDMFWTAVTFGAITAVLILAFWPADKSNVVVVTYDCSQLNGDQRNQVPAKVLEECNKRESNK